MASDFCAVCDRYGCVTKADMVVDFGDEMLAVCDWCARAGEGDVKGEIVRTLDPDRTPGDIMPHLRAIATGCDVDMMSWGYIVAGMDDDIRERVHAEIAPCTMQNFAKRYLEVTK